MNKNGHLEVGQFHKEIIHHDGKNIWEPHWEDV